MYINLILENYSEHFAKAFVVGYNKLSHPVVANQADLFCKSKYILNCSRKIKARWPDLNRFLQISVSTGGLRPYYKNHNYKSVGKNCWAKYTHYLSIVLSRHACEILSISSKGKEDGTCFVLSTGPESLHSPWKFEGAAVGLVSGAGEELPGLLVRAHRTWYQEDGCVGPGRLRQEKCRRIGSA